jgi:hypothetical protein
MPVPIDIYRFIDDVAGTMLDDILKSPSPEAMGQLIEELEAKSGGGGYSLCQKLDPNSCPQGRCAPSARCG